MQNSGPTWSVDRFWLPAAAGVAATAIGVGVSELAAALLAPSGSAILVVGALFIDLVPAWLKNFVISLFGTNDKTVLLICIGILIVILAAVAGVLEARKPPIGRVMIAAGGLVGVIAALTRAQASAFNALPSIVVVVATFIALHLLLKRLRRNDSRVPVPSVAERRRALAAGTEPVVGTGVDRRDFLSWAAGTAIVGILATTGGQLLAAGAKAATAARIALKLPRAAVTAPPIPAGASFAVKGLAPIVTPNADFYRIDTALQIPQIDPEKWSLQITGMVEKEITLSWKELLALPLEEHITTLTCVSNEVGGDLISNAVWLGYPIRKLLAQAKPKANADMIYSTSQDGWTATTPIEAMTDENREAILAIGMNGQPLPFEHGFPARLVVPGLYGYVSATKWVVKLEVTRFDQHVSYWTERGWSDHGPIKLSSRIDVPNGQAALEAGEVVVAGVAWEQHTGIKSVEVQVDGGEWNEATLAEAISLDTWRQWRWTWPAEKGTHTLKVRATNTEGDLQIAKVQDVVPNGSTGYHTIDVTVH